MQFVAKEIIFALLLFRTKPIVFGIILLSLLRTYQIYYVDLESMGQIKKVNTRLRGASR